MFAPRDWCICGQPCVAWALAEPNELPCARCGGKLAWANVEGAGVHVEQCARCLGCFVRTANFSEMVERQSTHDAIRVDAFVPPEGAKLLPHQALLAEARCPHCHHVMERVRFAQKAALVVDICPAHGLWLDAGELHGLLDHVRRHAEGDHAPDAADLADAQHWNEVLNSRLLEEQSLEARRARSTPKTNMAAVALGTAVGGPWLGLFLALRSRSSKR